MKTKIAITLIASIPNLCLAKLEFGQFGGCLNRTAVGTESDNTAFHCHFDSTFCLDGEEWLDTVTVASEGYGPCTCDDDYNSNVFSHGCYDIANTHAIECSASLDQCPEGWYDMGSRYNSGHSVDEECGHEDSAFEEENSEGGTSSCGKRCTCNFQYQSRDTAVTIGSTQYGMCFDSAASSSYCALREEQCASTEVYYNPHSGAMAGTDCNCDNVHLGACMDGSSFSHCAVALDNCQDGQTHIAPRALRESVPGVDCRLCRNSWDEIPPTESPVAASDTPKSPVSADSNDDNKPSTDDASSSDDASSAGSFHNSVLTFFTVSMFSVFLV